MNQNNVVFPFIDPQRSSWVYPSQQPLTCGLWAALLQSCSWAVCCTLATVNMT